MINTETRQKNFDSDKKRVDKFEPEIKRLCGEIFIQTAPERIDCGEATDLLVLDIKPIKIACRIRTHEYWKRYPYEFTIRSSRPSNVDTELQKILCGAWCEYNFYGFADQKDEKLLAWFIGDLKVFRREWNKALWVKANKLNMPTIKWKERSNHDKSSKFFVFDIRLFPEEFIYFENDNYFKKRKEAP